MCSVVFFRISVGVGSECVGAEAAVLQAAVGLEPRGHLEDVLVASAREVDDELLFLFRFRAGHLERVGEGVGAFERGDDAFLEGEFEEGAEGFAVGDAHVLGPARVLEVGVFGADRREVEAGRDRVRLVDLAFGRLHVVGARAEEDAELTLAERDAVLARGDAHARGLDSDKAGVFEGPEVREEADGVGAPAHAGDDGVGQESVLGLGELGAGLLADHLLELTHDRREGMRARGGAEHVVRVLEGFGPVAKGRVAGLLERAASRRDGHDLGAHELHPEDVGLLALNVLGAHVDPALEAE